MPAGTFKDSIEHSARESSTCLVATDLAVAWANIFPRCTKYYADQHQFSFKVYSVTIARGSSTLPEIM